MKYFVVSILFYFFIACSSSKSTTDDTIDSQFQFDFIEETETSRVVVVHYNERLSDTDFSFQKTELIKPIFIPSHIKNELHQPIIKSIKSIQENLSNSDVWFFDCESLHNDASTLYYYAGGNFMLSDSMRNVTFKNYFDSIANDGRNWGLEFDKFSFRGLGIAAKRGDKQAQKRLFKICEDNFSKMHSIIPIHVYSYSPIDDIVISVFEPVLPACETLIVPLTYVQFISTIPCAYNILEEYLSSVSGGGISLLNLKHNKLARKYLHSLYVSDWTLLEEKFNSMNQHEKQDSINM